MPRRHCGNNINNIRSSSSRPAGLVLRALSAALRLLVLLPALSLLPSAGADRRAAAASASASSASVAAFFFQSRPARRHQQERHLAGSTRGEAAAAAAALALARRGGAAAAAATTMAFATAANNDGGDGGEIPTIEVPADKYDGVRVYRCALAGAARCSIAWVRHVDHNMITHT